jgi:iron complex transport system substrate-binding protein
LAAISAPAPPTAGNAPQKPQRIMSTNMCADLLLLTLVPKDRIASITFLAHDAVAILMPGADEGIAVNHGTAEEVVHQRPDLILASQWSTPVMRRLAAQVGVPVVEVDDANSFEDIRRITRQIGAVVGEPDRAEALLAEMDRTLHELDATRPNETVRVVAWDGSQSVPGGGTLTNEIIEAAGAVNLAAKLPDANYSTFGIEELLAARPDAIMRGEDRYDGPSLTESVGEHPVVREAFAGRRITYPAPLYTCGLPQSAEAAKELREALATLRAGGGPW